MYPALDWTQINSHGTPASQDTAFEELCCQIMQLENTGSSTGHYKRAQARGGDAGVECYVELADGGEWGCQAKFHLDGLKGNRWKKLDESVQTALDNHPQLTRYSVCVPYDLGDSRQKKNTGRKTWDRHVAKWQATAAQSGHQVEFEYWGSSELIQKIQQYGLWRWFAASGFGVLAKLDQWTKEWVDSVPDTLGPSGLQLRRESLRGRVQTMLQEHPIIAVIGESGAGKSVLLQQLLIDGALGTGGVAIRARDLASRLQQESPGDYPILEALRHATGPACTLVLDAAEKCLPDSQSLDRLGEVLRSIHEDSEAAWRVALTCTSPEWQRVASELSRRNVGSIPTLLVDQLSQEDLQEIAQASPQFAPLLRRRELRRLTGNPGLLQLMMTDVGASAAEAVVGEASLIDLYWESLRLAQPQLPGQLKRMATVMADRGLDQLGESDTVIIEAEGHVLAEAVRQSVLLQQGEGYRFRHDLLADFAAQRSLLQHWRMGELDQLLARASNHSWTTAWRLLGLHMLEVEQGIDPHAWQRLCDALAGKQAEKAPLAFQWVREGIWRSVDPGKWLDTVFPAPLTGHSEQLHDALVQFRYANSATYADLHPEWAGADARLRSFLVGAMRIPVQAQTWIPVWQWLFRYRENLPVKCLQPILDMAYDWVLARRRVPELPLFAEVCDFVLSLAEQIPLRPSSGWVGDHREARQWLFHLVLLLSDSYPDRVSEIARRLSGLAGPEAMFTEDDYRSRSVIHRDETYQKRGPWDGGPLCAADSDFREIALSVGGAKMLVDLDPDLASQVFFALQVTPPHLLGSYEYHEHDLEECELAYLDRGRMPFNDFPPIQVLLQKAPGIGLDLAIRLVNFATDRWVDREAHREAARGGRPEYFPSPFQGFPPIQLESDGERLPYIGDETLLDWHRNISLAPRSIVPILMTLEKWLYDQMDAKALDEVVLERLLRECRSVAMLGVLIDLSLRHPDLLLGPLEPLVQSPQLIIWSHGLLHPRIDVFVTPHDSVERLRAIQAWHALPHRRESYRGLLVQCLVATGFDWPTMNLARTHWRELRESTAAEAMHSWLDTLLAEFDPDNWQSLELSDGRMAWGYVPTPEQAARRAEYDTIEGKRSQLTLLPFLCHEALQGKQPLTQARFEEFFVLAQEVESILDGWDNPFPDRARDVEAAVGAVGLLLFPEWIDQHPEHQELLWSWVVGPCLDPPFRYERAMHRMHGWDVSAAYLLTGIPEDETKGEIARAAIAGLVVSAQYETLKVLYQRLMTSSAWSTEDRSRLLHLGLWMSRFDYVERTGPDSQELGWFGIGLRDYWQRALCFVNGDAPLLPDTWVEIAATYPEGASLPVIGYERDRDLPEAGWNIAFLAAMWSWLEEAGADAGRADRGFLRQCIAALTTSHRTHVLRVDECERSSRQPTRIHPEQVDYDLMRMLAVFSVHEVDEEMRRSWIHPWLTLPISLKRHVEAFLIVLHQSGWVGETPPYYVAALQDMFDFATSQASVAGSEVGIWRDEGVARSLLGVPYLTAPSDVWEADRAWLVNALAGRLERWAHLTQGRVDLTTLLLRFLSTPAAQSLLKPALCWLERADVYSLLWSEELQVALVDFLTRALESDQPATMSSISPEYPRLLKALCDQSNAKALILWERLPEQ